MYRRPPNDNGTPPKPAGAPLFPAEAAFVVQFGAGSRSAGRVEHVVSGHGTRFASREELMTFMSNVLTRIEIGEGSPYQLDLRRVADTPRKTTPAAAPRTVRPRRVT